MAKGNGKKRRSSSSIASNSGAVVVNSWQRRPKNPSSGIEFFKLFVPNIWLSTEYQVVFNVHGRNGMGNLTVTDNLPVLHKAINIGHENKKKYILVIHGGKNRNGAWVKYLKNTYQQRLKPWKRSNPGVSILYIGGLNTGCK